jgi:hypothetical protein
VQAFSSGNSARKTFVVRKDVSRPDTRPKNDLQTDKHRIKELEKLCSDFERKLNEEKDHSQDVQKQLAEALAVNAEKSGLSNKRLREKIEDIETRFSMETLQVIGNSILRAGMKQKVQKL